MSKKKLNIQTNYNNSIAGKAVASFLTSDDYVEEFLDPPEFQEHYRSLCRCRCMEEQKANGSTIAKICARLDQIELNQKDYRQRLDVFEKANCRFIKSPKTQTNFRA